MKQKTNVFITGEDWGIFDVIFDVRNDDKAETVSISSHCLQR